MMDGLAVVEKVVEAARVHCSVLPHPNVVFKKRQGTCATSNDKTDDVMTASKLESFESYLTRLKGDVEMTRKANAVRIILLQLAQAVHHIHKKGWSHGEINKGNLRISESKKNVVLVQPSKEYSRDEPQASEEEKRMDIIMLSNLYQSILCRCSCFEISHDLLPSMRDEVRGMTSRGLLQHPYFWRTEKKVRFLCEIAQRSKEKSNCGQILKAELDKASDKVFKSRGWFVQLQIGDTKEKDKYQSCLNCRSPGEKISRSTVENVAREKEPVEYKAKSLRSLVNFIRNHYEHFWEKRNDFKACFLFDPVEEYWHFFNKRFPKLIQIVYNIAKQQELIDGRLRGYFEEMEPNQDLPETLDV